jgi:hypothetical protein
MMRYAITLDAELGETRIELASSSYADAMPLLSQLNFRRQDIDLESQSVALALAVLTSRYCGDHFELTGARIGGDYAEAIRMVLGPNTNVAGVDGLNRTISVGETDLVVERAVADGGSFLPDRPVDPTPIARFDWSGDFVDSARRSSDNYALGAVHTNAELLADRGTVSVALGLLLGRDRIRTLYVSPTPERFEELRDALAIVSIGLEALPA